jgi:anti-sigma regulatory factor (Ser/Thr protein kinase)
MAGISGSDVGPRRAPEGGQAASAALPSPPYLSESAPAVAASVPWARTLLAEFASIAGIEGERLEDIRLAVSEAVTNTVAYAYDGGAGEVHVIAAVVAEELWIVIADDGHGLRRRPGEIRGLGLGLGLMARLSDALTILTRSNGGVEIQMRFHLGAKAGSSASHATL